ncbi:MAG TPA: hypothetical protein VFZ58_05750 [Candidatus Saccharimonadales bacterium]
MAARLVLPQFLAFRTHAHAIMLIGVSEHSSLYEASQLAQNIASGGTIQFVKKADEKTGIAISQIRELYKATRSKSTGTKRVWVIEDAETMSLEAQNAFLKLLEEPPADVLFILCVKEATTLLPTVRSRTQNLYCQPVQEQAAKAYLSNQGTGDSVAQLLFLAAGSASELVLLASNEKYRQKQLELAATAKQLVSASIFEKIVIIQKIAGEREQTLAVLRLALRMLSLLASRNAAHPATPHQLARFLGAYENIVQNGNTKIQLLRAIL